MENEFKNHTESLCNEIRKQNDDVTRFVKDVRKYFDIIPDGFIWDDESYELRKQILKQINSYLKD